MSLTVNEVLQRARPVMPVLVIDDAALAVDMAGALLAGGVQVLEVTLRTQGALEAIAAIRKALPEVLVGAGTVIHASQFDEVRAAGAQFAVSPGCTERLADAARQSGVPYLPGVMTASEVMLALEFGYRALKLFPANGSASVATLKGLYGPFPDVRFCPTGGVTPENMPAILRLPNVACVGGSWIAPESLIRERAWEQIRQLAAEACTLARSLEA
jgi:2-dehydro-3-deoxyphosphogluconate aldolase/(4S)-4-hydroxy-2-oxoglutarate aldolase